MRKNINIQKWRGGLTLVLLFLLSLKAGAFTYDGLNYNVLSGSNVEVGSNKTAKWDIVIPANVQYNGTTYKVTSIAKEAFKDASILSIKMPEGLVSIGDDAFLGCENLSSIVVPNSVEEIGNGSFANCPNVTSITYGSKLQKIGKDIFTGLWALEKVISLNTTPPVVDTWGITTTSATLYVPQTAVSSYRNATVWEDFKSIMAWNGDYDDDGDDDGDDDDDDSKPVLSSSNFPLLKHLTIGNTVENVPQGMYRDCNRLKDITFGSTVKEIGSEAFRGCDALKKVVLSPSVETIEAFAFAGNSELSSIIMGANVATIGEKAFDGCPARSIKITAPNPPKAPNNTFSNYSGMLYLQSQEAMDAYYDAYTCWDRFSSYEMIVAETIESNFNGTLQCDAGTTFQLRATLLPENVTLPQIFWRSTNPEVATVDANGLVTIHANVDEVSTYADGLGQCSIIAESLYADGPVLTIPVIVAESGVVSGVEDIITNEAEDAAGDIDFSAPVEVYNLNGVSVGTSMENLAPGIYIIRQGAKTQKTMVK